MDNNSEIFKKLEQRVSIIEDRLLANTNLTAEIHADMKLTREVHQWVGNAKGFFAILGVLSTVTKWLLGMGTPLVAIWAWMTHGPGK